MRGPFGAPKWFAPDERKATAKVRSLAKRAQTKVYLCIYVSRYLPWCATRKENSYIRCRHPFTCAPILWRNISLLQLSLPASLQPRSTLNLLTWQTSPGHRIFAAGLEMDSEIAIKTEAPKDFKDIREAKEPKQQRDIATTWTHHLRANKSRRTVCPKCHTEIPDGHNLAVFRKHISTIHPEALDEKATDEEKTQWVKLLLREATSNQASGERCVFPPPPPPCGVNPQPKGWQQARRC